MNENTFHIDQNQQPVVVLAPLSPRLITSLRPPLPESSNIENEDCNSSWEPDSDEDSNPNFSITNDDTHPKKRQKITENNKEHEAFSTDHASQHRGTSSTNRPTDLDEVIVNKLAESTPTANNGKNNMQKYACMFLLFFFID